jgi:spore coat protein U-like protein
LKPLLWALTALALLAGADDTAAGTVASNLRVQVTLLASCSVIGNTLDFGGVPVGNGGPPRTKSHVSVACPVGMAFQVGINDGSNAVAGQRRMKHDVSEDFLSYELYKHSTGFDRFGDAIISQRKSGVGLGQLIFEFIPVFGEIFPGQDRPAGFYLDNAVVTVYF